MAIVLGENAYIDLDTWKTWADSRNYNYSDYNDEAINGAIVVSSVDFIDIEFDFKGEKVDSDQVMQLPSTQVTIDDIINGAAQAVWQQVRGLLLIDPSAVSQGGSITKTHSKLGTMEEDIEYAESTERTYVMPYTTISKALAPYVSGGGSAISVMLRV